MQKLILDTNVIVSALLTNALPAMIVYDVVLTETVELCLSDAIFAEYVEVVRREKFGKFPHFKAKAAIVLNRLQEIATFHTTPVAVEVLKDKSDNKFLELAVASSANYLITGNTADFPFTKYGSVTIVTPREYWDNHQ
jgi:putative PIN family toxin of toxin-antitoxin system